MSKICLFAGTTEGRKLTEFLSGKSVDLIVCVATEYGEDVLENHGDAKVIKKRLSEAEMLELFQSQKFDLVIDATHPYAVQVSENIKSACISSGTEYQRILRDNSSIGDDALIFPDIESGIAFLNTADGNILLTTGSKEISKYSGLLNFSKRVYARVLPMSSSLEACTAAGLKPAHIIAMQGPFSEEMNIATLKAIRAKWLVTKDSGDAGGFTEKASAAKKADAKLIVIGRPPQTEGINLSTCISELCERFELTNTRKVSIIGIGPGNSEQMTMTARKEIEEADCLIGAKRMIESVNFQRKPVFEAIEPENISDYIFTHQEFQRFTVLMSGDSGFYSGTQRLLPYLKGCKGSEKSEIEILPGISSLSYFCSKLRISYQDVHTISLHGRGHSLIPKIKAHKKLFVLTGGQNTVNAICRNLSEYSLSSLRIYVGERLGYPDERISQGSVDELMHGNYDPLSVMLIENPNPDAIVTQGLPDTVFSRESGSKGLIPMTKSEIRAVCLSKLALTEHAVCWDIGSGTGSVSIEMAIQAKRGTVYAIEQDPDALALSQKNAQKLFAENITFIHGSAPEACENLPTPTHVFIGGSSGNLNDIFKLLSTRNSDIKVVTTAVTLESISEMNSIIKQSFVMEPEVVLMQTARSKEAGVHHLMLGGNPVCIYSMRIFRNKE